MSYVRSVFALFFVGFVSACAVAPESDPSPETSADLEAFAGPTRAEHEAARAASDRLRGDRASDDATSIDTPARRRVAFLQVIPLPDSPESRAENGRGELVPTSAPAHLDVRLEGGWPGRALDPHLVIGALTFTQYRHEGAEVLRFDVADVHDLPALSLLEADTLFVQWGDDERSRLDVVSETPSTPSGSVDR